MKCLFNTKYKSSFDIFRSYILSVIQLAIVYFKHMVSLTLLWYLQSCRLSELWTGLCICIRQILMFLFKALYTTHLGNIVSCCLHMSSAGEGSNSPWHLRHCTCYTVLHHNHHIRHILSKIIYMRSRMLKGNQIGEI